MQETWVWSLCWEDCPGRRERLPMVVFWPGEFHGLYSPPGHKESDTTEQLSLSRYIHLYLPHGTMWFFSTVWLPSSFVVPSSHSFRHRASVLQGFIHRVGHYWSDLAAAAAAFNIHSFVMKTVKRAILPCCVCWGEPHSGWLCPLNWLWPSLPLCCWGKYDPKKLCNVPKDTEIFVDGIYI